MQQWYINKMLTASTYTEAKNYADMAQVSHTELFKLRYLIP